MAAGWRETLFKTIKPGRVDGPVHRKVVFLDELKKVPVHRNLKISTGGPAPIIFYFMAVRTDPEDLVVCFKQSTALRILSTTKSVNPAHKA